MSDANDPTLQPYDSAEVQRARAVLDVIPEKIGRYRVLERIGGGGMGDVFVAEQTEPIKRRVALKLIKAGMDTKQVVARFEAERQALAMIDHPNVARVFDAGATDTGRPYFVMELIRGVPITQYCDDNKLTTRQRVELLVPVCQAVQHAHQKGIIHRDLKPTNVLVTLHDGKPVPKVIDFGIAKATSQPLTDKTVYTEFRAMIGTPAYMSPEQAEMSGLDIDTRSDIYSLGVLAYELLTGSTPFDTGRLVKAGLMEIQRIIKEEDPPRPSLRLSTMAAATRTTVATHRATEPARISKLIAGELDWIVMKAMEKDRRRRYETANDLAADLERHLAGEPIVAAPPSAAYRTRKLLRRHKRPLIGVATLIAALSVGATVAAWQWRRATSANAQLEKTVEFATGRFEYLTERTQPYLLSSTLDGRIETSLDGTRIGYKWVVQGKGQSKKIKFLPLDGDNQYDATRGMIFMMADSALERFLDSEGLRKTAEQGKDAAETEAYIANLALAQAAMQADRWPEARQRLDACPESKRGWEWAWLSRAAVTVRFSEPGRYFAASPDGTTIAVYDDNGARLYDTATGQPLSGVLRLPDATTERVCFSKDSKSAILASFDNGTNPIHSDAFVRWFDGRNGRAMSETLIIKKFETGHRVALSPDGAVAAVAGPRTTELIDTRTGAPVAPLIDYGSTTRNVYFDDESGLLWLYADKSYRLWNTQTGQAVGPGGENHYPFAIDRSRSVMVSESDSGQIMIRNFNSDAKTRAVLPLESRCDRLAISRDASLVVTRNSQGLQLWDAATGIQRGLTLPYQDYDFSLSNDCTLLLTNDGIWEVPTGRKLAAGHDLIRACFNEAQFIDGQNVIAMTSNAFDEGLMPQRVQVTDVRSFDSPVTTYWPNTEPALEALAAMERATAGAEKANSPATTAPADGDLWYRAIRTPDGKREVTVDASNVIRFRDPTTRRDLLAVQTKSAVAQLRFTPDGTRLILDFADGTMEIWDTRDYAARQKDRDLRFAEIPAARDYTKKLLATKTPTDKLKDFARNDPSISLLRKLVVLEQLDIEIRRIESAAGGKFSSLKEQFGVRSRVKAAIDSEGPSRVRDRLLDLYGRSKIDDQYWIDLTHFVKSGLTHGPHGIDREFSACREAALEAEKLFPNNTQVKTAAAMVLYRDGRFGECLSKVEEALAMSDENHWNNRPTQRALRSLCLYKVGRHDEAQRELAAVREMQLEDYDHDWANEASGLIDPATTRPATKRSTTQPAGSGD